MTGVALGSGVDVIVYVAIGVSGRFCCTIGNATHQHGVQSAFCGLYDCGVLAVSPGRQHSASATSAAPRASKAALTARRVVVTANSGLVGVGSGLDGIILLLGIVFCKYFKILRH